MAKDHIDGVKVLRDKSRKDININIKRILFYEMYKTSEDPYTSHPYRIVGKLMDGKRLLEKFDVMWKPPESCHISEEWINGSSIFMREFESLQSSSDAFNQFITIFRQLSDYSILNRRVILCGFGNHGDDDIQFKRWFLENSESWEYGKIFYPLTMDLSGASSVCMVDMIDKIGEIDLAWAAGVVLPSVDLSKINKPMYRIDTMIKIYKSRFCPTVHVHTVQMMERRVFRNGRALNNLRRENI